MFTKLLIANRGEIAVRIIRACKEMGIRTVAVYSKADAESIHVALADEAICIGEAAAKDSYLNQERIISAAIASKAQAIHPGYGFLSENADFARACEEAGITFIGPSSTILAQMGDKLTAKAIAHACGVPTIPGSDRPLKDGEEALAKAVEYGFPIILKAAGGGGGRGIRVIHSRGELLQAYPLAVAESEAAFGDGAVYLEKYVHPARHIEVQILADEEGHVVCLGERDCSVQRRHQKLLEESPSPAVDSETRTALFAAVADAVRAIGYTGAGTLEFLRDPDGNLWFMEMNVRLQVEHAVSEMLTLVDLVKWQIRTAAGVSLPFSQTGIPMKGAVIECRINALSPGTVSLLHVPGGPFVRFDTYLVQGVAVSPFYDSLVGKLIVYAATREEALRKMRAALCELVIDGVETNIAEQLRIISDPRFSSGRYDLTMMEG